MQGFSLGAGREGRTEATSTRSTHDAHPTLDDVFTATALLTAAASVGQPQSITTEDQSTTTSGTPSTTTGTTNPTAPGTPGTTTDTTSPAASDTSSSSTSGYGTTRTDTTDTTGTTSGAASGASGAYGASGTTGTSGTAGTMDRDASSSAAGTGSSSASLQGQDAEFVRKALEGGREEVQNAQLALQHAQRAETRNAASMMLEDHQRANQQLEQLAQRKGLSTSESSSSASCTGRRGAERQFDGRQR